MCIANRFSFILCVFVMRLPIMSAFINPFLLKSINPATLRNLLRDEMNRNYTYLTYPKAKKVLHNEVSMIDIYGDNLEDLNVEHVFPQFSFKHHENKKQMRSDLHNLYLCNSKLNSLRQNFKYMNQDEISDEFGDGIQRGDKILDKKGNLITSSNDLFRKQGYLMIVNQKKKQFIPTQYSRGKIARSLGYFAIKYDYLDELKKIINLDTLLIWNNKDPVDDNEYLKNLIVFKHQHNINPFILEPELLIYCLSDQVEIDIELLKKSHKRYTIDPMHVINFLLKDSKREKETQIHYEKVMKMLKKKRN